MLDDIHAHVLVIDYEAALDLIEVDYAGHDQLACQSVEVGEEGVVILGKPL